MRQALSHVALAICIASFPILVTAQAHNEDLGSAVILGFLLYVIAYGAIAAAIALYQEVHQ